MKKIYKILILIVVIICIFNITSLAKSEVSLSVNSKNINIGDEFTLNINTNNIKAAACTIWLYFDNQIIEYSDNINNVNVVDNRIIYTWVSETGTNIDLSELLQIKMKAKKEGATSVAIIGEIYDEKGNKLDLQYKQLEIIIGEKTKEANINTEKNSNVSSENVDLDILRLSEEGINPNFNPNVTEYYIIVNENVESIDVTAIPKNNNAKVQITGNNNLKKGANKITIKITSKDNSKNKEYIINVTKTNDINSANANLETLAVENFTLSPEYEENITNYNTEVSKDTQELNVLAIPNNMNAKVEIKGNKNLQYGKNRITVTVTAQNGVTQKKYLIDVYKRNEAEEIENDKKQNEIIENAEQVVEKMSDSSNEISQDSIQYNEETQEKEKEIIDLVSIIGCILSIMILGITIIRIIKNKKNKHNLK